MDYIDLIDKTRAYIAAILYKRRQLVEFAKDNDIHFNYDTMLLKNPDPFDRFVEHEDNPIPDDTLLEIVSRRLQNLIKDCNSDTLAELIADIEEGSKEPLTSMEIHALLCLNQYEALTYLKTSGVFNIVKLPLEYIIFIVQKVKFNPLIDKLLQIYVTYISYLALVNDFLDLYNDHKNECENCRTMLILHKMIKYMPNEVLIAISLKLTSATPGLIKSAYWRLMHIQEEELGYSVFKRLLRRIKTLEYPIGTQEVDRDLWREMMTALRQEE
jgi:hypothetical protein